MEGRAPLTAPPTPHPSFTPFLHTLPLPYPLTRLWWRSSCLLPPSPPHYGNALCLHCGSPKGLSRMVLTCTLGRRNVTVHITENNTLTHYRYMTCTVVYKCDDVSMLPELPFQCCHHHTVLCNLFTVHILTKCKHFKLDHPTAHSRV